MKPLYKGIASYFSSIGKVMTCHKQYELGGYRTLLFKLFCCWFGKLVWQVVQATFTSPHIQVRTEADDTKI